MQRLLFLFFTALTISIGAQSMPIYLYDASSYITEAKKKIANHLIPKGSTERSIMLLERHDLIIDEDNPLWNDRTVLFVRVIQVKRRRFYAFTYIHGERNGSHILPKPSDLRIMIDGNKVDIRPYHTLGGSQLELTGKIHSSYSLFFSLEENLIKQMANAQEALTFLPILDEDRFLPNDAIRLDGIYLEAFSTQLKRILSDEELPRSPNSLTFLQKNPAPRLIGIR